MRLRGPRRAVDASAAAPASVSSSPRTGSIPRTYGASARCGKIINNSDNNASVSLVGAQVPACVCVAYERPQNFQVMTMYDRAHADSRVGVDLEARAA